VAAKTIRKLMKIDEKSLSSSQVNFQIVAAAATKSHVAGDRAGFDV